MLTLKEIFFSLSLFLIIYLASLDAIPASIQTAKLKFKLSARNLVDKDEFSTTDGYVVAYYSHDGGRTIRKLGRTDTVFDKKNPDWSTVFEFQFDRKLKQYWYFHVYDEDHLALDETVGRVWVNVADYMDKRQVAHANLDVGGYLTVKSADCEYRDKNTKQGKAGILPFKKGTPNNKRIRFTVLVRGLEKNVKNYATLIVTHADGVNGAEIHLGKSTVVTASTNPGWHHVFTLNWSKNKDKRLHFKVYDSTTKDIFKESDKVADGWIEVNDYIAKGESFTVLLPTKGTLTMTKVKD